MKHKFSAVLLSVMMVCMVFAGSASARSLVSVGSAEEFQKALDNGVTDIIITSSFSGNFVIPRWVYSISGTSPKITISPSDISKPTLYVKSTLTISDLTIICDYKPEKGRPAGIDA